MATPADPSGTTTPATSTPAETPTPPPTSSPSTPASSSSTPTTSSSAPTSASSSAPSTSSTPPSTSSSSPTTSSTPVTSNTPPTTTPAKVTTTQGPTTTAGGGVVTRFTTSFESNTSSAAASSTAVASSGKSFFKNTGAVAGTFSVVGLIVAALIIALITNGIRRRRARKFDRELAEATMEAASAPKPIFLDDEDDVGGGYGARGGYGAGGMGGGGGGAAEYNDYASGGQFSDVSSHGTYGQPPMSVAGPGQESYGMREMGHGGGVGPGEIFDPYSVAGVGAAAGAAGIGVARARSQKAQVEGVGYGAALQEGGAPYAAFAAPQGGGYDPYANNPGAYQRNADILEAAGMGVHAGGAGALARGPSMNYATGTQYQGQQLHHRTSPSQEYPNLGRSKSSGGMAPVQEREPPVSATSGTSGATQYFSPVAESYASHYQAQGQAPPPAQGQPQPLGQAYHPPQPQPQPQQGHQRGYSTTSGDGDDMDDAYGGYVADMHAGYDAPSSGGGGGKGQSAVPNPFVASDGQLHQGSGSDAESRYSDEEVEEEPRRVLKVANE